MTDLTIKQWLLGAAEARGFLKKHGVEITDVAGDVKKDAPKVIAMFKDMKDLVDKVKAAGPDAPVASPSQTVNDPAQSAAAHGFRPSAAPRVTAEEAIAHVERHGLTPAEQAMFDRASAPSG
jgi:hypothetical protein